MVLLCRCLSWQKKILIAPTSSDTKN